MKKRVWLSLLLAVCMIVQMAVLPVDAVMTETENVLAQVPPQKEPEPAEWTAKLVADRWEPYTETEDVSVQTRTVFKTKEEAAKEVRDGPAGILFDLCEYTGRCVERVDRFYHGTGAGTHRRPQRGRLSGLAVFQMVWFGKKLIFSLGL